jgi:hypothetical protein
VAHTAQGMVSQHSSANVKVEEVGQTSPIEGVEHMGHHVFAMIERALKERGLKND